LRRPTRGRLVEAGCATLVHQQLEVRTHFLVEILFEPTTPQVTGKAAKEGHSRPYDVALIAHLIAAEMRSQLGSGESSGVRQPVFSGFVM
jgi:hypothetical protein